MGSTRSRFTSAHLIALLALFVALGGSAYAFHLGKNAVKARNIKSGAVVESKLAGGAVTDAKIAAAAVTDAKIAAGAVTDAKIAAGAVTRAKIAAGAVGADSVRDVVVRSAVKPLPDVSNVSVIASCAPGERLIGGTGNVSAGNSPDILVTGQIPTMANGGGVSDGQSPTGWTIVANNYAGGSPLPSAATAYALCLK
jgi:hypothetical protein